ncbi:hypothetical protein BV22DRAFT_200891 [Leucogyrophana mollusca]|uniref:Uncharacterized protein n=1 Tax=Leucogyrophana mollusca TaxID=85980 RepID=A0ACB8BTL3_9AGAM|nr:hypothetical protein BV22DRAFT_200891 [Leucogyrophana mollusca]
MFLIFFSAPRITTSGKLKDKGKGIIFRKVGSHSPRGSGGSASFSPLMSAQVNFNPFYCIWLDIPIDCCLWWVRCFCVWHHTRRVAFRMNNVTDLQRYLHEAYSLPTTYLRHLKLITLVARDFEFAGKAAPNGIFPGTSSPTLSVKSHVKIAFVAQMQVSESMARSLTPSRTNHPRGPW